MAVITVTPPIPILTIEEVRAHLRIEHTEDDMLIMGLVQAAQSHLSGPDKWFGRAIGRQVLELQCHPCELHVRLPYPPFVALVSVTYLDAGEVEAEIDTGDMMVVPVASRSVKVWPKSGRWPALADRADALRIRYEAGYEADDFDFASIRPAMLLLIAHWYGNREAVNVGNIVTEMPMAVETLLSPLRIWSA